MSCAMPETLQDLVETLAGEISLMSEKEKTEFRHGWIHKTPNFFRPGDQVSVRQFNGKLLKGKIVSVFDSVSGRRIKIIAGPLVLTVGEDQVSLTGVEQK